MTLNIEYGLRDLTTAYITSMEVLTKEINQHQATIAALERICDEHERRLFELENRRPQ